MTVDGLVTKKTGEVTVKYVHGIRANLGQFNQQLLQVFFVGLTIGLQRNVVPVLAEVEFGVPAGSFTLLMAFIISFGFVKGAMNFLAGRLSENVGRRRIYCGAGSPRYLSHLFFSMHRPGTGLWEPTFYLD